MQAHDCHGFWRASMSLRGRYPVRADLQEVMGRMVATRRHRRSQQCPSERHGQGKTDGPGRGCQGVMTRRRTLRS